MRKRAVSQSTSQRLPLALTMGEPAGIGPDITLLCWQRRKEFDLSPFYIVADPQHLAERMVLLGLQLHIETVEPEQAFDVFETALPVVALEHTATAKPGKPDVLSAPAVIAAIRRAANDVTQGRAAAIVTNPIAKSVLYAAGFKDPGHTEYLARLWREIGGEHAHPVMMLWSDDLAVVPVTIHIPLRDVPSRLTQDLIVETGRIVAHDLALRFRVPRPRIAVAGLNPHAGENGALGQEDLLLVKPAVDKLRAEGIDARGPLSADTMFHAAARTTYDVALCMYHDQALIPLKTLAFDHGVNVTLGLPFIRTSPDHGTAFDMAGSGKANPDSLAAALRLAARLADNAALPSADPQ
jgi:4-hydroxythreonine-4-phosphate dehydrogenase